MATQTTEQQYLNSVDKEFQKSMSEKLNRLIEETLHDVLVEKGWDGSLDLVDWKASFYVTFIQETYEDEE